MSDSMPNRIKNVIKNKGEMTKYETKLVQYVHNYVIYEFKCIVLFFCSSRAVFLQNDDDFYRGDNFYRGDCNIAHGKIVLNSKRNNHLALMLIKNC